MITFRNRGLVDLRAITTFGVNSKDTKSAIGQFGTGFKYAVAVALRMGATIVVMRGLERYKFTQRRETIRNDEFGMVYMNEQQLGFTTHLGAHWEPWQAFRELYCNMLDEADGEAVNDTLTPQDGYTHVYLDHPDFEALWPERHKVVLPSNVKPMHADDRLQIFDAPSDFLYYRNVRVAKLEIPARFTYNVLSSLELTEDRTLSSLWDARAVIARSILAIAKKPVLQRLLFIGLSSFESTLEFNSWNDATKPFIDMVHKGRANIEIMPGALAYYRTKNPLVTLPKKVPNAQRQERRDLKSAIALCAVLGYNVTEYKVIITDELPEGMLGCVYPKHSDAIFIARRTFSAGLLQVTGTLLEEYLHLKYAMRDCTRQLQNHLLDALVRAAERLQKETATKA